MAAVAVNFVPIVAKKPISYYNELLIRRELQKLKCPFAKTIQLWSVPLKSSYFPASIKTSGSFGALNYSFYIYELWFNLLTLQQKQFVIAHEAMHITCKHAITQHLVSKMIIPLALLSLMVPILNLRDKSNNAYVCKALSVGAVVAGCFSSFITNTIVLCGLNRKHEYEADKKAVQRTNNFTATIQVLQEFEYWQ